MFGSHVVVEKFKNANRVKRTFLKNIETLFTYKNEIKSNARFSIAVSYLVLRRWIKELLLLDQSRNKIKDKNIKLHIVTDIKIINKRKRHGSPDIRSKLPTEVGNGISFIY